MREFQFSAFHNPVDIIFMSADAVVLHVYAGDAQGRGVNIFLEITRIKSDHSVDGSHIHGSVRHLVGGTVVELRFGQAIRV